MALGFEVLTLPDVGPEPEDRRRWVILHGVGRVVASKRNAAWNDETAVAEPFEIDTLGPVLERRRWWDGLYGGDARTTSHGIVPTKAVARSAASAPSNAMARITARRSGSSLRAASLRQ